MFLHFVKYHVTKFHAVVWFEEIEIEIVWFKKRKWGKVIYK